MRITPLRALAPTTGVGTEATPAAASATDAKEGESIVEVVGVMEL